MKKTSQENHRKYLKHRDYYIEYYSKKYNYDIEYKKKISTFYHDRNKQWRNQALTALGGECVRCGFTDVRALQIDHVNGDGGKERSAGMSQVKLYKKIFEDQTGYQLLCANCNWIKREENKETGTYYGKL